MRIYGLVSIELKHPLSSSSSTGGHGAEPRVPRAALARQLQASPQIGLPPQLQELCKQLVESASSVRFISVIFEKF